MSCSQEAKCRIVSASSWLFLLVAVSVSVLALTPRGDADRMDTTKGVVLAPGVIDLRSAGAVTKKIKHLRVGDRVLAKNPEVSERQRRTFSDPDPAHWQQVDLLISKNTGGRLEVSLLRPMSWLEERAARVGGEIFLDIPHLNVYGPSDVVAISDCPQIKPGRGSVVIGTFRHTSGDVLEVTLAGLSQPIGTTADHPFWSADRSIFVRAGELEVGEKVSTYTGRVVPIVKISSRPSGEPVFNLEVAGEHVYYVSTLGALVHNAEYQSDPLPGHFGPEDVAFGLQSKRVPGQVARVPTLNKFAGGARRITSNDLSDWKTLRKLQPNKIDYHEAIAKQTVALAKQHIQQTGGRIRYEIERFDVDAWRNTENPNYHSVTAYEARLIADDDFLKHRVDFYDNGVRYTPTFKDNGKLDDIDNVILPAK